MKKFLFVFLIVAGCLRGEQISVLHLEGTPYELGFQHGKALKKEIEINVKALLDNHILNHLGHPRIKTFHESLPSLLKFVPEDYLDEMQGLAEGAEIPFEKILLLNLFPEMFHCVAMTVSDRASKEGNLYHVRVLDYSLGINLQNSAVILMVKPEGKIPFLNVSFPGFIGSVTGMNLEKIAIGEIGGKGYGEYEGMPMPFLIRSILENGSNLQEIKNTLESTLRTCEYYYVISDGKSRESIGVYATGNQIRYIYPGTDYAILNDKELEAHDHKAIITGSQIDSSEHQTVVYQDGEKKRPVCIINRQPQDCLILCSPKRYYHVMNGLTARYGKIGVEELIEILKTPLTKVGNLHNAIFSPSTLDAWISIAAPNGEPASSQTYFHFSLLDLNNQ